MFSRRNLPRPQNYSIVTMMSCCYHGRFNNTISQYRTEPLPHRTEPQPKTTEVQPPPPPLHTSNPPPLQPLNSPPPPSTLHPSTPPPPPSYCSKAVPHRTDIKQPWLQLLTLRSCRVRLVLCRCKTSTEKLQTAAKALRLVPCRLRSKFCKPPREI